ncbi:hypothetical protein ABW19_dt0206894 [Dactylella cylindrospora]|nr:hypothetical protein ABW19_dt0206894 [Dactylella cylindrospora]
MVVDAFERDKQVYIPFTHKAAPQPLEGEEPKPSVMDMVSLESLEDYQGLKRNSWGIPTPTKASLQTRRNCIGELQAGGQVGVALKEQYLGSSSSIPVSSTDWSLDMIIVGDGNVVRQNKGVP